MIPIDTTVKNQGNLQRLINHLSGCERHHTCKTEVNSNKKFNMGLPYFECGSPACVAGHCAALDHSCFRFSSGGICPRTIQDFLLCDYRLASHIYYGDFSAGGGYTTRDDCFSNRMKITIKETVDYLKTLLTNKEKNQ